MDGVIGLIWMFASNFAPRNWTLCNGQLLAISQNTALFSILGTTYGGNGQTTFGLPNMQGRVPIGTGNGPGLTPRQLGESGGQEMVTLTDNQIPHTHATSIAVSTALGEESSPAGHFIASRPDGFNQSSTAGQFLGGVTSANQGGGQPHNNLQPYSVVNFVICLSGIYPSRN